MPPKGYKYEVPPVTDREMGKLHWKNPYTIEELNKGAKHYGYTGWFDPRLKNNNDAEYVLRQLKLNDGIWKDMKDIVKKKKSAPKRKKSELKYVGEKGTWLGDLSRKIGFKYKPGPESGDQLARGGMVGTSDMSAGKMTSSPARKKKIPQYYRGGGTVKKNKQYAYGGRVAKYRG